MLDFLRLFASQESHNIRNHMGHGTAQAFLLQIHVMDVFPVKSGRVGIEVRRGRKDLRVSGPAHALIPLGAVGGHIQEVADLAPESILKQLIDLPI